jgi:hypothetical protein
VVVEHPQQAHQAVQVSLSFPTLDRKHLLVAQLRQQAETLFIRSLRLGLLCQDTQFLIYLLQAAVVVVLTVHRQAVVAVVLAVC